MKKIFKRLKELCKALILIFFVFNSLFGNYFILAQEATDSAVLGIETSPTPTSLVSPEPTAEAETQPPSPTPTITLNPTPTPSLEIKLNKVVFEADENLELSTSDENVQIELKNNLDQSVSFTKKVKNNHIVEIERPDNFRPGKYHLKTTDSQGKTEEKEFLWGVLAINTNKSIYLHGETAYLQMAVLDDSGHTVCDANLELKINNEVLSTKNGQIKYSDSCGRDNVTDNPDYFAYFQTGSSGQYQMSLKNLDNGYEINDSFEVKDNVPFEIERVGATRINPSAANYIMTLKIKANQDFQGEIKETIPQSFTLVDSQTNWQVDWKSGETHELNYQYDAPDVSPQFYLLGPLTIGNFSEARRWQIASDASCVSAATGNWTAITWTNCTGNPGGDPISTDTVTITDGHVVTLDTTSTIAGLTLCDTACATDTILTHSASNGLTVNGTVTINGGSGANDNVNWEINAGSATVSGAITYNPQSTTAGRYATIIITTGTLNANGGITFENTAGSEDNQMLSITGAGTVNLKGAITSQTVADIQPGTTSIFNYADTAAAQTVVFDATSSTYAILHLNNTQANGVTLNAPISTTNVTGDVVVQTGIFKNGGFAMAGNAGKTFQVDNGAVFEMSAASTFPSTFTYSFGATSTVRYRQTTTPLDVTDADYGHLELLPAGTATYNFPAATVLVAGNFTCGNGTNAATCSANAASTILDVNGDFTIAASSTFVAHASNAFTVGGSWANSGTFTHSNGTVTFDAGATGKTINSGGTGATKDFYTIVFNSSTGGWTIQTNNLIATNNFTITDTAASGFTVNSVTVTVQGTYSIADAETANTTWTTATLYLNSATAYTVGSKNQSAETYTTLQVGANTDIRIWNSTATTFTVDSTGSLYSQDHANVNGDLYIWGDYNTATNDYWNYADDFDGTASANRQVDVLIDPAATITVNSGDTLAAIGTSVNRSIVSRQGALGGYPITVSSGGTINFQYTDFNYLEGTTGLNIQSGSTVTSLDNTKFDNLVNSGTDAFITVASSVIGTATKNITGVQFDNTGSGANCNVNRTGTDDTGKWDFGTSTGTFDGETYDCKDGANEADPGMLWWDDSVSNQSPNTPTSLAQKTTGDVTITTGGWINATSVKFTASATDLDASDTLYLCVEKDILGTAFSNTEDSCGIGVAYSGTAVTVTVTISGITDASEYHWQARVKDAASAYSSWVSYDVNLESARDFGIDTTAPTGGTVYDGTVVDTDASFNDGSLSSLSANWSGFNFNVSGISSYDYSIGTTAGATDVKTWTANGTTASVTASSLTLQTSQMYYFNVRANDNAGNSSIVSSNGQLVNPSLAFSLDTYSVAFANLNAGNSYTDTKNTILTTSTNAYNGYVVRGYRTDFLRSSIYPSTYIGDFAVGSYAAPGAWGGSDYGFGYTSSDTSIQGQGKFPSSGACQGSGNAPCYAPFSSTAPGDIVADHTATVTGSPILNEQFTLTYKVSTSTTQSAGPYATTLVYTITAQY